MQIVFPLLETTAGIVLSNNMLTVCKSKKEQIIVNYIREGKWQVTSIRLSVL
jgi:hypothetical protein